MIICVTGTNTDVGKTIATAAVASALSQEGRDVVALKPLQTGTVTATGDAGDADASTISRLAGVPTHQGWGYPEPLAPNLAARRANMTVPSPDEIAAWVRTFDAPGRVVLVEGAGGLLVRFGEGTTLVDVAKKMNAPLLVVTSLGLGSLNAAELTCARARAEGLEVLGLIGGAMPKEPDLATRLNLEELPRVTGASLLGVLPEGAGALSPEEFAHTARGALDLDSLA